MMMRALLKAALIMLYSHGACNIMYARLFGARLFSSLMIYHVVCLQGYDSPTALLLPGHLHLDTL